MKIRIEQDEDFSSPRDPDTDLGIMVCFHKKYDLGDEHNIKHDDFVSWDRIKEHLKKVEKATHILPLFLLDHSGVTINTTGFSCPWDSGQIGFIYATVETVARTGVKLEDVEDQLRAEVKLYNQYITGDVWGFSIVNDKKESVDSCWGFYGQEAAKEAAEQALKILEKKR